MSAKPTLPSPILVLLLTAAGLLVNVLSAERPNVILAMADDMAWM